MLRGISLKDYRDRFGIDLIQDHSDEIDRLREAGLIERDRDLLRLTGERRAMMSNEVFASGLLRLSY